MHRLLKSSRISYSLVKKSIVPASKHSLPGLFIHNYSTVASDLIAKYRQLAENKSPELWQTYTRLKQNEHIKDLDRDDFLQLRASLWKQSTWGAEERILQVLDDMKQTGYAWTVHEYNEYFMAKLFQVQYKDILDMYAGEYKKEKMSLGAFNVILATYIQLGQIDDAIQLIHEAKSKHDVIPDIRDFDRTMHRCMPKNKQVIEVAKKLITEHAFSNTGILNINLLHLFERKRTADIKWIYEMKGGEKLDITTYNILIKGYCDARLIRDAIQVYYDMEKAGVKPNTYICASMLSIYAHTRDVKAAEEVVRETIRGGHKPDELIYNQLIKVYFKGRQAQKAFQVLAEIQKDPALKINDVILNTMIDGLVINKEIKAASLFYQQMMQSEYKPDIVTCNTMLKGYTKVGDTKAAIGIISDMHKMGMEPDTVTYTTLIDSVFKRNQPTTAEEMMKLIDQMGMTPNIYTFNAVINGWIQNNNIEEAEKTYELMKSSKYQLRPTIHTFTNLIQGYVEQTNLRKAMETFQTLLRSGVQPDRATFNFMIVGFLTHDRLNDAYICLERMISMKLSPTKDTWKLLLEDCCQKKDWNIGQKVVKMLDQSGFVIKSDSLKTSYTIVKNHCK